MCSDNSLTISCSRLARLNLLLGKKGNIAMSNAIFNSSGSCIGRIEGSAIFNSNGSCIGRVDGDAIFNSSGSCIGRTERRTESKVGGAALLLLL